MTYTVLARRYRSKSFDELIGQEPIARTLRNAISAGRVAHAYLFCGTRGVGKTSSARLFAVALNGGTPEVDAAIMAGRDSDVIEIDAASNTGVDNVRDLIANAAYRPLRGKFKIYIIDEVHMLSQGAFNALLKTMEEPPEHVKFILCTTDPHKVPPTIQSRCQRFDFRPIPPTLIGEHLRAVVKQEGLEAEPELIHAVAKAGNGSMRDALSLLDRVMATGEKKLKLALLEELLGLPESELVGSLLDAIAAGDAGAALTRTDALLSKGISIDQIIESLTERVRDLMVMCACGPDTTLVDLSDAARKSEAARARMFDAAGLVHMIALCENLQRACKSSSSPRAMLDALIVRLSLTEKIADVTAVVAGSVLVGSGAVTTARSESAAKKR
ncbi:MAG: DNA polymerase III subunit gamma/tau [Phycisphaerales bacterium]|jgi:DNA polymerase-3 subunit gamma/tau|nr:DNA polymerase III subunit gamma/tau [Phycisphaerales bacterium]